MHELLAPVAEFGPEVRARTGRAGHRAQIAGLVAGVVARTVEDDPVHRAARREVLERVRQPDLATAARRGALQDVEHGRVEDIAADDRVPARRGPGRRLLRRAPHPYDAPLVRRFHHRAAVEVGLLRGDLHRPGRIAHRVQAYGVAPGGRRLLQFEGVVEVVLDGALVPAGTTAKHGNRL
ncbi:hypothetical protein GCM10010339_61160 [Streptomyces alanosinicus]|uniref:Uncharacterized protein n=1 Tax=Streptomyces alanosinicus TaxID=68171 RepID=A0A919D4B6_9ACTN|nr:hypothetical protein GCM10010339_61160 [Streptomyces alanosinicus]